MLFVGLVIPLVLRSAILAEASLFRMQMTEFGKVSVMKNSARSSSALEEGQPYDHRTH